MKTPQLWKTKTSMFWKKKEENSSDGKCIFVYIRRSTANKQELSLKRQDDNAKETILQAGYNPNEVEYYIESVTAYNWVKVSNGVVSRRRTEFTKMLSDIDRSPIPVTLLTYEDSRLSRNDIDTQAVLDRLFWEYEKEKKNINKIIFNGGEEWTEKSNKGDIKQRLLDRYKESETIWKRSSKASLRELRRGRFILSTPVGINRLKPETKEEKAMGTFKGLEVNEKIPFIIKAWEMKADYKSKVEINRYLKRYNTKIWNTFEQYFRTHIYMGYYPDSETWELLPMKFETWRPPIPEKLWYKVQETLWVRRVSKYWDKQEWDILSHLLKWEQDAKKARSFSVEFPKWKYKSYKSNAFSWYNKSETKVIKEMLPQIIWKIADLFYWLSELHKTISPERLTKRSEQKWDNGKVRVLAKKNEKDLLSENLERKADLLGIDNVNTEKEKIKKELVNTPIWTQDIWEVKEWEVFNRILDSLNLENFTKALDLHRRMSYLETIQDGRKIAEEQIKESLTLLGNQESFKEKEERISELQKLEKEKNEKEREKANTPVKCVKLWFWAEVAQQIISELDTEILELDKDINNLSHNSSIEEFIDDIPEVLTKIFELCSKVLSNKEISTMRDEITKLVEITTFELSVSTKKELTVKLFEGLEDVLKLKNKEWLPK